MFSEGANWKNWMKDFKFGTMAFIPKGEVRAIGDQLRNHYDPVSAATSSSHITITQPFKSAPSDAEIFKIESLIHSTPNFNIQVGPATSSPNQRLIWLDVNPKEEVLNIREKLHDTDLFRTDLPFTKGFIPHLTLSEAPREPKDVHSINDQLNAKYSPWNIPFDSIVWIVPNEDFVFQEHQVFQLQNNSHK